MPRLRVRSWFIDGVDPHAPEPFVHGLPTTPQEFLAQLPRSSFNCWVRGHSGLVGFGRALRITAYGDGTVTGSTRFDALAEQWRELAASAEVIDDVRLPGSGLVGFTAITFTDDSQTASVIDVPRYLMGRMGERVWLTAMSADPDEAELTLESQPLRPVAGAHLAEGTISAEQHLRNVEAAIALMRAGAPSASHEAAGAGAAAGGGAEDAQAALQKIVLARDVVVTAEEDIDVRAVLGALNQAYPATWTFNVAGLIGATPELLVGVRDGAVSSRVLAGTYQVRDRAQAEMQQAREQLAGAKDTSEHACAIRSLEESLRPLCTELRVDEQPYLLTLPNVIHLATDAHGTLGGLPRPSILDVAKRIHPTAAVGGTPRERAMRDIARIEGVDRGRYAGPVGWIDGRGEGQMGIALRCGQLESRTRIRLWAGGGIMPDSQPQAELAETWAKCGPMLGALGLR